MIPMLLISRVNINLKLACTGSPDISQQSHHRRCFAFRMRFHHSRIRSFFCALPKSLLYMVICANFDAFFCRYYLLRRTKYLLWGYRRQQSSQLLAIAFSIQSTGDEDPQRIYAASAVHYDRRGHITSFGHHTQSAGA
jgi:hypothetical protein